MISKTAIGRIKSWIRFIISDRGEALKLSEHWAWAILILLVAAFFAARQINLFPPAYDEYLRMLISGWIVDGPFTFPEVADALIRYAPDHSLGYYFTLNIWGWLAGFDIVLGRALGIFFGLLSLSITYRLCRDFVAPIAGLFGLIILASNAFYNLQALNTSMYSMLPFLAGLVLWLYLRMISRPTTVNKRGAIALGLATFILLNVHPFGIMLPLTMGVYHLLFVKKDRTWRLATVSVCIALLLYLPYALTVLVEGHAVSHMNMGESPLGSWRAYAALFTVMTNGQPIFAALAFIGLALTAGRFESSPSRYLIPVLLYFLIYGVLADNTDYITNAMRFHLPMWPLILLFFSAGFYGLYRIRRRTALLLPLWIVAGLSFNQNVDWSPYAGGEAAIFAYTPWQLVSKQAEGKESAPLIVWYRINNKLLDWPSKADYSQREHFFDSKGIAWKDIEDPRAYKLFMYHKALIWPEVWTVLQTSVTSGEEIAAIESAMNGLDFQLCETAEMGIDTRVYKHVRNGCD